MYRQARHLRLVRQRRNGSQVIKIHYPVDWLIKGGATFDHLPTVPKFHEEEDFPLKLSCTLDNDAKIRFYIHAQGRILAEGDEQPPILAYLKAYMDGVRKWATELRS
jgi:hypothetical protein